MFTIRKWWLLSLAALLMLWSPAARADGLLSNTFLASGAGTKINNIGTGITQHKLTWNIKSGSPAACTVALDSSSDGVTWSAGGVITGQTCTANGSSVVTAGTVNYVRINVTALSASTTIVVTWTGYVNAPGGGGSVAACTTTGGVIFENGTNNTGTCLPNFTYQALTPPAGANVDIQTIADGGSVLSATPDGIASSQINFDVDGNIYMSPVANKAVKILVAGLTVDQGATVTGSITATGGIDSCTPPAVNGVYQYIYNVTASAAVPATCPLVGLVARDVTGTTDTIITADANGLVAYTGSAAVATALPTPTTLLNANFFTVLLNNTTANVVVTPTTWAISINGAAAGAGGAAVTIAPHVRCAVSVDRTLATTWDFDCVSVQGFESAGALGTGTTLIGGQDASANAVIGTLTARGGDETGTGGATSQGGNVVVRGGNDAATNAASAAGMVELVPGLATGATQGLQGLLLIAENYIKGGGTSTQWDLQCIVTTTAMTVNDCGASPTLPIVGVAFAVNSNTVQVHSIGSQTPVAASAAVTVGHTVCAGSTAGKVTDSGATTPCGSGAGFTVGEVIAVSGTYNFPIAGSVTLSTTLPLIQLNRVQGVGVGGISGVLAVANGGTGTGSTLTGVVRGGSPLTASELSGDVTTSGSNVTTIKTSVTLTTPVIGAATGTSLLLTGNIDGTAPVIVTTGTTGTPGATFNHSYSFNQEATAGTGVTYTLPTAAAGKQYCVANDNNGTNPDTGVLTVATSAAGQFIVFTDGTLSATGGNVTSGGAAADSACFVGIDTTHWHMFVQSGTWTKH